MTATSTLNAARWLWDRLFGPPKVRELPDGGVRVRLLGRVFEASDYEGLFGAVNRERERLLGAVIKMHEGAGHRAYLSVARVGPGDIYQRDLQRIEDRLAVYNEFLGHLVRRLQARS
jgi:hypothetical protein